MATNNSLLNITYTLGGIMARHAGQKEQIKTQKYVSKLIHVANVCKKPVQQECKKNIYF